MQTFVKNIYKNMFKMFEKRTNVINLIPCGLRIN